MHPRYTRGEMGNVWKELTKFYSWLDVEIAVLEALSKAGEIPDHVPKLLKRFVCLDIARIEELDKLVDHDMNAFLRAVSENFREAMHRNKFSEEEIEEVLSRLHRGLTSYDVEDTALALRLKISTDYILSGLEGLLEVLREKAWEYKDTPQIGRTHLKHAEPITFGLKLLNWYRSFDNHRMCIKDNRKFWQAGKVSGAVGTFTHLGPEIEEDVALILDIKLARVSSQIVSREGIAYLMSILAHIAGTLAKCSKDIEDLSRTEIGEVFETHAKGKQGSSAMPHKTLEEFANSNKCERIYSLAKLVRASAHVGSENIDIRHEQDLTHSASERIIISGSLILVDYMIALFTRITEEMRVDTNRMLKNIWMTGGLIFSGHVTSALMDKGMPREEARELVTGLCHEAAEGNRRGKWFKRVVVKSEEVRRYLSLKEIEECFSLERHLRNVDKIFERFE